MPSHRGIGSAGRGLTVAIDYLGTPDAIDRIITDTGAECMVIAFSRTDDRELARLAGIAHQHGLRVWVIPRMFDVVGERARIEHVGAATAGLAAPIRRAGSSR